MLRLPLRFLRGHYGRLALTVFALACGVALVCAIDLVNRAVSYAFVEVIDTMAGRAALQVTAGANGLLPEELAQSIEGTPGVELAVPAVSAMAFTTDGRGELLTVHGIDITNEAAVRTYEARDQAGLQLDDPLVFLSQPSSIVITRTLAARRGLAIDDGLELDTPTGRRTFVVRGIIEPAGIGRVHGGNLIVMDLLAAEQVFTRPGLVNRIDVVVRRDGSVDAVRRALASALPAGLEVTAPAQHQIDLQRVTQSVQVVLQGVGLLGLVAAFLVVFNRLSAVFEGRLWQMGVLRAMGVSRRRIWGELVSEGILLGVAGVALGLPLGTAIAHLMLPVIATTTGLAAKLAVPEAQLTVRWSSLGLATLLGLGATIAAAVFPARRAAATTVAAVVTSRRQEMTADGASSVALIAAAGLAIAALVVQAVQGEAVWGVVASVLMVIAAALAARPIVGILRHRAVHWAAGRLGPNARLAVAALARSPRRTALTVATLGVGFGVVTWLWVLAGSFEQSVVRAMHGMFRSDFIVSSARMAGGSVEATVDDGLVHELEGIPGIAAVAGHLAGDWQYRSGPIGFHAYDRRYFTDDRFGRQSLVGPQLPGVWTAVAAGDAAVISTNLAHNVHIAVGDRMELDTPNGPLSLRVAGMIDDFLSPRGSITFTRDVYERLWRDNHITQALVMTQPGADPKAVRDRIVARLGIARSLRVLNAGELVQTFAADVRRAFSAVYALAAMVLIVVALGVADTVAAGVLERRRELATMSALGIRRRALARMALLEASFLGVVGLALGLTLGLALGTNWVETTFPSLLGWILELHLPTINLLATAVLAVFTCLLAGLVPAYRSTQVDLAEAMRDE